MCGPDTETRGFVHVGFPRHTLCLCASAFKEWLSEVLPEGHEKRRGSLVEHRRQLKEPPLRVLFLKTINPRKLFFLFTLSHQYLETYFKLLFTLI